MNTTQIFVTAQIESHMHCVQSVALVVVIALVKVIALTIYSLQQHHKILITKPIFSHRFNILQTDSNHATSMHWIFSGLGACTHTSTAKRVYSLRMKWEL